MRFRGLALRVVAGAALLAACDRPDDTVLHVLTATRTGNGNGAVTSTPAGIDCGADCSEAYAEATRVTLHASAAADSAFLGWIGGGCAGTGDCVVDVVADTTVEAEFALLHTLTTTRAGTGSGTITSTPAGISCGADCSEVYADGTSVTLHASPGAGSIFAGWSGGGCAGAGDCVVGVAADTTVQATFSLSTFSCTYVTNAQYCTNPGVEINLGPLTGTACRTQCESRLPAAGVTSGCWIVALDTNCYCRNGVLSTGSTRAGGSCGL